MATPKPAKNESKQTFLKRCITQLVDSGSGEKEAVSLCHLEWGNSSQALCLSAQEGLTLSSEVTCDAPPAEGEPKAPRRFVIVAYTGGIIELGWMGRYIFSLKGIKTMKALPALREHDRCRIVGTIDKAWVQDNVFYEGGIFSRVTEDGIEAEGLADENFPWQASIGIWPLKIKRLGEKESMKVNGIDVAGPCEVWLESIVRETSFCSLGADDQTAAISLTTGAEPALATSDNQTTITEDTKMDLKELKEKFPALYEQVIALGAQTVDIKKLCSDARQEGIAAERTRVQEIMAAESQPEAKAQAIKDGLSLADSYKVFFEAEKKRKDEALLKLKNEAPPSAGSESLETTTTTTAQLAGEAKWKKDYSGSKDLQAEFGCEAAYVAYCKAKDNNLVKVFGKE